MLAVAAMMQAIGAGKTAANALNQRIFIDFKFDHPIKVPAPLGQQFVKRLSLRRGARIAIEDCAHRWPHRVQLFADQRRNDLIRDQLPALHHGLGLQTNWCRGLDRRSRDLLVGRGQYLALMAQANPLAIWPASVGS